VDDDGKGSAGNCDSDDGAYSTIQAAIAAATAGDTISVCPGTYVETGQIVIGENLTIAGAGASTTVVKPAGDTGSSGDAKGWFLINDGVTFNLSDVTLDGTGHKVWQAIRHLGQGTISDCAFKNIKFEESGPSYAGTAVAVFGGSAMNAMNVDVTGCAFSGIGRIGVLYYGSGVTDSTFSDNTYTGKGSGDWLDYAVEVGAGAQATITDNTISGNTGEASVDHSTSAGIIVTTYYGAGSQATISGNEISGCTTGIGVGYLTSDTSVVTAHLNDLAGNTMGIDTTAPVVDATGNWWGSDSGPTHTLNPGGTGDAVSDNVAYSPWLGIGTDTSPMTFIVEPQVCLPVGCIQQGVNLASDDDTINVHDGTYDGFKIDSKDNLTVVAASSPVVSGDKVSLPDGSKALVAVQDSDGVTIDGLTVDASGYLENNFSGVIYYGSSGTIQNSTIHNIEGTGGQARAGIRAQDGSSLAILDNTISEYDKAGIVSRSMDSIDIERNVITTTYHGTAPNGIDIGRYHGTSATIKDNEISGADYDQFDAGEYETEWSGAAILIMEADDSLEISGNTVFNNDVALDIESDSASVTGNDLSSNLYGIVLWNSNPVMKLNSIAGNTSYGVYRTSDQTGIADATSNWWGSANGPRHATNTFNVGAQGDAVSDNVRFVPWLDDEPPEGASFAPVTTTNPGGSYASIQAGVNASNPGGTVNAKTGVFSEKVTVGKSVIVQAGSSPVVDCGGPGNGFTLSANNVTINGFEIRNCSNGIQGQTSNSTISNNIIHDNLNYVGSNGVGISLWGDNDNNQISGNTVYNNDRQGVFVGHCDFAGPGGACTVGGTLISSGNTISGNVIHDNGLYTQPNGPDASQYGIQLWNGDGNEVKLNEISNHKGFGFGVGVYLCSADSNDVHDNTVHDNQYNIAAYGCGGSSTGNNIHLNTLSAPTDSNVRLFGGSPSNTVNDNTMSGGVYGVRVSPGNTDTAVTANDILGFKQNGVRIDGSSDVDVSTNNIDGQGACNSSSSQGSSPETDTRCYGVEWIDSTGTVSANTVTGVKVGAGTGAQTGVGIRASARSGKTTSVTIDHNVVSAYQKNGMVITGQYGGTVSATVDTNTVTGFGPINFIAQNGVQVSDGASATVSGNNISGHDYTGSSWSATGILVIQAADGVVISGNNVHDNMEGIYAETLRNLTVSGNTVTKSRDTGVYLLLVDNSEVSGNSISSGSVGLWLADSSGIAVKLNTISKNGDGVVIDGDSHNDTFTDNKILINTSTGVTVAPYGVEPSGIVFRLNQIVGNGTYGIDNTTSKVVDALSNWWGDVTGPYHPTKNPGGLGDDVSDNVLFDPWLKAIKYVGDTSIPLGGTANLRARFLNSSGTTPLVAGVNVHFDLAHSGGAPVMGSPFSALTDGSGVASVPVTGLGIGFYTVTARWNPLEDSTNLTVSGPGDSDGDGVLDAADNCPTVYNPDQLNSDGGRRPNGSRIVGEWASNPAQDKLGDACDPDDDNDALLDISESELSCPFRLNGDSDGDRKLDGSEVANGYNACSAESKPPWESSTDSDGDGLLDWTERSGYNTCAFTGDTLPGWSTCTAPRDSDGDGCADTVEILDLNGDRSVDSGDQGLMNRRVAGMILADDPVSERVFDLNKDGDVDSGDQGLMNRNTCMRNRNQLGCPVCPPE
jgi:parallel beta-helix repeat protein